ncbi:MAG: hypothetical protein V4535_11455 [Bacteroidota bacterium]
MDYKYNTPENAIISLETAFCNKDLENVLLSKDFLTEAQIILRQANPAYDLDDEELVYETAELLKLTLIQYIQEKGFADFNNVEREFSQFIEIESNLYSIVEVLTYPNGDTFTNTIYLSNFDDEWKNVMTG